MSPARAGARVNVVVVIPTLNEEQGVGPTIAMLDRKAFRQRGWRLDVLVVDGQSKDATVRRAAEAGAEVVVEPRRGYGRAYKTGFAAATARGADVIITGDADATYPFDRAHEYVARFIDEGLLFATLDRYADLQAGAMRRMHRLGNWVLSTAMRVLFFVRIRDSQSGMWIIHRDALARLPIDDLPDGMAFSQEIKIEAWKRLGRRVAELPGSLRARIGEPVIESWRDGLRNLRRLVRKRATARWKRN